MNAQTLRDYGALAVSIMIVGAFLVSLGIAYRAGDTTNLTLLIGAVVTQLGNVVGYWIGSSVGSTRKEEALTKLAQPPAASVNP